MLRHHSVLTHKNHTNSIIFLSDYFRKDTYYSRHHNGSYIKTYVHYTTHLDTYQTHKKKSVPVKYFEDLLEIWAFLL
jgi:hypothetical protein